VVVLFITTGIFGSWIWTTGYKELFNLAFIPLSDIPFNRFMIFILIFPSSVTCALNIYRVLDHVVKQKKPLGPAVKHIITFSVFTTCWLGWYLFSTGFSVSLNPVIITESSSNESVWFKYPFITRIGVGITFGEMVSRLILAHMLKETFPLIPRALKILIVVLLYSGIDFVLRHMTNQGLGVLISESTVLIAYLVVAFISYYNFVSETIRSICTFLNISVLSIPHKNQRK